QLALDTDGVLQRVGHLELGREERAGDRAGAFERGRQATVECARLKVVSHRREEREHLPERDEPARRGRAAAEATVAARQQRALDVRADEEQLRARPAEAGALEEAQVVTRRVVV